MNLLFFLSICLFVLFYFISVRKMPSSYTNDDIQRGPHTDENIKYKQKVRCVRNLTNH